MGRTENMKNECELCGKELINLREKMLVIKDELWKEIQEKANGKGWICPECMIKLNGGRKFNYSELKTNLRGAVIPCNIWYIQENRYIELAKEDFKKETRKSVLEIYERELKRVGD